MWLTKLKVALIEKNTDSLGELLDNIPQLSDAKEVQEAIYLLKEASELIHTLKDETTSSMKRIQKNLAFLRSTEMPSRKLLDVRS